MYRQTKEERQAWWNNLSEQDKIAYQHKWEHKRDKPDRKELDIPALTKKQRIAINETMRRIGMEQYIVLKD